MRSTTSNRLTIASLAILLGCAPMLVRADVDNRSAAAPTSNDLALKAGESFTRARARIVKAGWKPVRVHQNDKYEYSGTEKELVNRGFFEVDSCSIDAGSLCIMYYRKSMACLRLDTRGEQLKYMEVRRWSNECPESQ
jgi:hypothetical protein